MSARWCTMVPVLAFAGCHKDEPAAAPAPEPKLAPAPLDAASAWIELLHAAPSKITVSSSVENPKIKPEDIADHDFETAWNSRTGELAGAWIEVTTAGTIEELRMTVGHTGHGPKHEDYFAMNPRIKRVTVLQGNNALARFVLDTSRRDLQALRVQATGTVRVRVDEVEPGSRPTWREACVSELEAWGTLPPSMRATRSTPTVAIAPAPMKFDDLCAGLANAQAEYNESEQHTMEGCKRAHADPNICGMDEPGAPQCESEPLAIDKLAAPWRRAAIKRESSQPNYGIHTTTIVIDTASGVLVGPSDTFDRMRDEDEVLESSVRDVLPGGPPELVLRMRQQEHPETERLVICRAEPVLQCSLPITLAGEGWTLAPRFAKGQVFLDAGKGQPPADAVGTHVVVFP